ncbi:MAG: nucleotide sugar dehydrogenase [Bdellovibrionaceae bacterium]|nr:nucleotide sugar dehydrogenase [Pseudobdellovibrionaceae bacterium]
MTYSPTVSVIGLGYVGLPVAVAMAKKFPTIGFDINQKRIQELKSGKDYTKEVNEEDLSAANIEFSSSIEVLKKANFHIVAVPTPVNDVKQPDLTLLLKASETVGKALKKGDIVVYESTVYPGATEEDCVPILEKFSNLKAGVDFKVGYSPERINPGDKEHTFTKITKVVSAQDEDSLNKVSFVYGSVVEAGVYPAESIKVAEAAKVIENTQRDLNISLMNELSVIFERMDIDTLSVIKAASTKWNFLPFTPGLVGGHCIGVDPYYLTYKAEKLGYMPEVILAGRRINDSMGQRVAERTIKAMIKNGASILGSTVTILGLTFKENCPDLRNTRVVDIISALEDYGVKVQICDPEASTDEAHEEYGLKLTELEKLSTSDAVVVAVAHKKFIELGSGNIPTFLKNKGVVFDVKGIWPKQNVEKWNAKLLRM